MNNISVPEKSKSRTQKDVVDLGEAAATLWRGKALILFVSLIFLVLGGVYAYGIAVPKYKSTAVVMLNNREETVVDLGSVMGGLGSDSAVINTEAEILKSRTLLGKVVDELNLVEDPEFNPALRPLGRMDLAKLWVKRFLGIDGDPYGDKESRQKSATIDSLLSALTIKNIPQTLVFQVTAESTDREKSALIADTLVDLYILNQLEVKFEATEQATSWLTERVTDLQAALETAEEKAKEFRANTPLISSEALQELEIQVKGTRDRIDSVKSTIETAKAYLNALTIAETPEEKVSASKDPVLERLLGEMQIPGVQERFDSRFLQIKSRTQEEIDRSTGQLNSLQSALQDLEKRTEQQSQDLFILQQLSREAEATRLLYEYFLSRLKETSAQQGIQQADSRVISLAVVPNNASAPRKKLILAISTVLGLIFGSSIVLLQEAKNNAFRTPEDVEDSTGYSVIGQVPLISAKERRDAIDYLKTRPTSAAAEAIRNLRTSILLSNIDAPPKIIMTCSAIPGEGKTTVALALAMNFAAMGKNVLLMEGDIRRRTFSKYLSSKARDGIVSILLGGRQLEDVVVRDELIGADVLLGDQSKFNAADIFSSNRFEDLMREIRTKYDVVILDTPPVLVVPDARVICQHVDSIVFVVKWDSTESSQVKASLSEFERAGKPVTGILLNQISPRGIRKYGYGGGYGSYAAYGKHYYDN